MVAVFVERGARARRQGAPGGGGGLFGDEFVLAAVEQHRIGRQAGGGGEGCVHQVHQAFQRAEAGAADGQRIRGEAVQGFAVVRCRDVDEGAAGDGEVRGDGGGEPEAAAQEGVHFGAAPDGGGEQDPAGGIGAIGAGGEDHQHGRAHAFAHHDQAGVGVALVEVFGHRGGVVGHFVAAGPQAAAGGLAEAALVRGEDGDALGGEAGGGDFPGVAAVVEAVQGEDNGLGRAFGQPGAVGEAGAVRHDELAVLHGRGAGARIRGAALHGAGGEEEQHHEREQAHQRANRVTAGFEGGACLKQWRAPLSSASIPHQ